MKQLVLISTIAFLFIFVTLFYLLSDFKKIPPTLYFNANIITINDYQPKADAMYVVGGRIDQIGTLKELNILTDASIDRIDMEGVTIMPGFIDVHTHFALSMFLARMHDLSGFKYSNNEGVWSSFKEIVSSTADNEWIVCKGIDPILIEDLEPPTRQYLDQVSPQNPVIILSQSLHSYWANSKAFELAGISKETLDASDHSYYEKDPNGELTGLIVEQEAFKPFAELLMNQVLTTKVLRKASGEVMKAYAKNGNTTIVSTGLSITDKKPLILLKHLSNQSPTLLGGLLEKLGQLPERQPMPRHFVYMRHDMPHLLPEKRNPPNDFYDVIGTKHWYDGSPYIGSMYMERPYLDTALTTDILDISAGSQESALVAKENLKNYIREHHQNGWQIAIHTQGDAAINEVVGAFSEMDQELDFSQSRHRLEHCLMLPRSVLDQMKHLNLSPSFHINHLYYYGDALNTEILGHERTENILPLNAAYEHDLNITLHADQPMFESVPFRLIQTAVERKTNGGNVIGENEKIELMQAIKAVTINAAWQIHKEDKIGSLEKGKYADFIVLEQDPLKVPIDEIGTIQCLETYINGNKVDY
ncbi:MAG: amidohydrolase [Bacteroidia bacterium]|nr:amidohydrolase [Bacteroidia bacterium]